MYLTKKNCTKKEAEKLTSRTSAWRLFAGKIEKINYDYHKKIIDVNYDNIQFDVERCYSIAASSILRILDRKNFFFQDIVSEAVCRFLETSGKDGSSLRLWRLAKYTCYDFFKKKIFQETNHLSEVQKK